MPPLRSPKVLCLKGLMQEAFLFAGPRLVFTFKVRLQDHREGSACLRDPTYLPAAGLTRLCENGKSLQAVQAWYGVYELRLKFLGKPSSQCPLPWLRRFKTAHLEAEQLPDAFQKMP